MERRNFLKYLMGLSACACSGCRLKFNNAAEDPLKNSFNKDKLEIVKFPICYHCNLNCAYCSHFSPIAPKYEVPVEVFERDVKQLHKITNGKINQLVLMGGEPLLHKDLEKLIEIVSNYFPDSFKRISTNGLLLCKMNDNFWKICKKHNFSIKYSPYTLYDNFPTKKEFQNLSKKHDVYIYSSEDKIETFDLMNLSKETKNYIENYNTCDKKIGCTQIDNGKIYPCSVISNIKTFNAEFKNNAFLTNESDYLDIHKINSMEEIIQYLNKPKEFCKYCGFGHNIKTAQWKLSKKEVSEWHDL